MRNNLFGVDNFNNVFSGKNLQAGGGNDPDTDSEEKKDGSLNLTVRAESDNGGEGVGNNPFISGVVDSKTRGYERYADCFVNEFGPIRNSIKLQTLNSKVYRI